MTWNEFKNWVDNQLTDEEKNYPVCYIDIGVYGDLKHIYLFKTGKEITIH